MPVVEDVQVATVTFTDLSSLQFLDVTVSSYTEADSLLVWSAQGGDNTPNKSAFRAEMINSTNLRMIRATNTTGEFTGNLQLTEFTSTSDFNNQEVVKFANADSAVTITTVVDETEAFVKHSGHTISGGGFGDDDYSRLELVSVTSLDFQQKIGGTGGGFAAMIGQACRSTDFDTQEATFDDPGGSWSSDTETITDVSDQDLTMLFGSGETDVSSGGGMELLAFTLGYDGASTTVLKIERATAATNDWRFTLYVVKLSDGTETQRGDVVFGTTDGNLTEDITAVDETLSIVRAVCLSSRGDSHGRINETDDDMEPTYTEMTFVDTDTIRLERDITGGKVSTIRWEVTEWNVGGAGLPIPIAYHHRQRI